MGTVPEFSLPTAGGGSFGTAALLQRRAMVLALVHGPGCEVCTRLLESLAGAPEADLYGAAVGAVSLQPSDRERAPIPVAHDPSGEVVRRFGAASGFAQGEPCLVVADRYGAIHAARPVHGFDPEALVREALEWIHYTELQCPE